MLPISDFISMQLIAPKHRHGWISAIDKSAIRNLKSAITPGYMARNRATENLFATRDPANHPAAKYAANQDDHQKPLRTNRTSLAHASWPCARHRRRSAHEYLLRSARPSV